MNKSNLISNYNKLQNDYLNINYIDFYCTRNLLIIHYKKFINDDHYLFYSLVMK